MAASPHLELGGDIDRSWGGFEPFVAFDFVNTWAEGFKEHGADSMNMKQKDHFSSMLRSSAGLRIYENWTWKSGTLLLKQQAAYVNRKMFHTGDVNAAIVGGHGLSSLSRRCNRRRTSARRRSRRSLLLPNPGARNLARVLWGVRGRNPVEPNHPENHQRVLSVEGYFYLLTY